MTTKAAPRPSEWHQQWSLFQDDEQFLFADWIAPLTFEVFRGKHILECGCGGGQHTSFMAPLAATVTAVDLNTIDIARRRNQAFSNVFFVEADLATMDLKSQFDVVICIGVIHHTDDPDRTFEALYRHCKPGGRVIVWTYSAEGNELVRFIVEPLRKALLRHLPRPWLVVLAWIITMLIYPIVHTIYRIPFFRFMPYFDYFSNFRRLSLKRNVLNVFDKLNAPQTHFTTQAKCSQWFNTDRFEPGSISIRPYAGVSYSLSGIRRH